MGINNFEIRKTSKNIFNSELFLESENVSRNSVAPNKVIDYLINDSNKINKLTKVKKKAYKNFKWNYN